MSTINEVINSHIENALSEIHTAFPAQVLRYDATKQCADMQPVIKKKLRDDSVLPMPVIHNVPIVFPSSGGALLSFPVNVGDTMLIICCERSLDAWLSSDGAQIDPQDTRKFNISDAVAIPGLYTLGKNLRPVENNVTLKYLDGKISINNDSSIYLVTNSKLNIDSGDDIVIHSAKSIQIKSDSTLKIECSKAEFSGDIECKNINCTQVTAQTEVTAGIVSLTKHTHVIPPGTDKQGGTTSPPV